MGPGSVRYTFISIHAPARGATTSARPLWWTYYYFNPRSRKGSDQLSAGSNWQLAQFQSTLPQGERRGTRRCAGRSRDISIHAPARGATTCRAIKMASRGYFNPRSRKGSDLHQTACSQPHHNFNPRSRKGSDQGIFFDDSACNNFNPRSRKGSDTYGFLSPDPFSKFQSTLPQGERRFRILICRRWGGIFQSTLPQGERPDCPGNLYGIRIDFNPRSRKGSDKILLCCHLHLKYFNPRSRKGSDWGEVNPADMVR